MLASLFDSFSFLYFQCQDFRVLLNVQCAIICLFASDQSCSAPTCSLSQLRSCKLHFPCSFAGCPAARDSQWKALAGDRKVGGREKPGYFSPSLSLFAGQALAAAVLPPWPRLPSPDPLCFQLPPTPAWGSSNPTFSP